MDAVAWERFQQGTGDAQALGDVRPQILGSWSRSRATGVDPERLRMRHIDVDSDSAFIRAGSRVLMSMADVLTGTNISLMIADPAGGILWRWEGVRELGRELDRHEIGVGCVLGEETAGTNGISLALADRRACTVSASEHYKSIWHHWTCAAAPIVHPTLGRVAGAVCLTSPAGETAGQLLPALLRSMVGGVRGSLAEAATNRERRMMDAHVRHSTLTHGPVVTLDATTMIVNDEAAALSLDRGTLWAMLVENHPRLEALPVGDGHLGVGYPIIDGQPDAGFVLVLHRRMGLDPADLFPAVVQQLSPLEQAERRVIVQALRDLGNNKSDVALHLGISRGTLYERLRRYGLK